jgi:integrase
LLKYYSIEKIESLAKLTLIDLENWLSSMKELKVSSYNQHLRSLQSFYTWLKVHDFIQEDISKKLSFVKEKASTGDVEYDQKRKAKKKTFLTNDELEKILSHAKSLDKKLRIALMSDMGLRRSEVFNIRKEYIKENTLLIPGKGGTFEELEMTPLVSYLTHEYLKLRKDNSEYLIVSKYSKEHIKNSGNMYLMVKRLAKKAGINDSKVELITPHAFRRSMICNAELNGENHHTIQTMARHKNFSTTTLYLDALKNEAANKVFASKPMPNMEALKWDKL